MGPTGLILLFFWNLFGPNPPIVVSKETTYLTAPLRKDGLPDYERYLLEASRERTSRNNNAAVILAQVFGPRHFTAKQYRLVCDELNIAPNSNKNIYLEFLQDEEVAAEFEAELATKEAFANILQRVSQEPWTSDELPALAEWVRRNKEPLNRIVEASKRTNYYFPSPTLLNGQFDSLMDTELTGQIVTKEAAHCILVRAMWHLGENRFADSWSDLHAVYRLSRLVSQGHSLVEQDIAYSRADIASDGTLSLLNSVRCPASLVMQIHADLKALSEFSNSRPRLSSDRLMIVDAVVNEENPNVGPLTVDTNEALRVLNGWYDKLDAALAVDDYGDRTHQLRSLEDALRGLEQEVAAAKQYRPAWKMALNRRLRSQVVGKIFVALLMPAAESAIHQEMAANTRHDLVKVAALLSKFRPSNQRYPEALAELANSSNTDNFQDRYFETPYVYERVGTGYLLYSLGPNGQDDGGSNYKLDLLKGKKIEPTEESLDLLSDIPEEADDISILMPN